ncbi:MAG: FkbM family methyltransferase [Cyanobacteriota bacterium]|nr:FkbM family methyltransferase [Cyanobacteriota bacterium]
MSYSLINCKHGLMLTEDSDMISSLLRIYGEWAETSFLLLEPLIPEGGLVVDVGANIGTLSLAFANRVGPSGRVLAFEAQRKVFYNLCSNILLNKRFWIEAHQCLASNQEGATYLPLREIDAVATSGINRGGVSFLKNLQQPQTASGHDRISIHALDTFLASHQRCDLIKIDVEGAEPMVLQGLQNTIRDKTPFLYVECGSEDLFQQLMPLFATMRYKPFWHPSLHYNPSNFRQTWNITGNKGDMNLLCVPEGKLSGPAAAVWQTLHAAHSWQQVAELFAGFEF